MASAVATSSRLSPVNFTSSDQKGTDEDMNPLELVSVTSEEILAGALLNDNTEFKNQKGKILNVAPVIVEFRRLLQSKGTVDVVPGISNKELMHGVVGLYSVSLSDMTPDTIYATVCDKWAKTIVLLRDVQDTLADVERKKQEKISKQKENTSESQHTDENCVTKTVQGKTRDALKAKSDISQSECIPEKGSKHAVSGEKLQNKENLVNGEEKEKEETEQKKDIFELDEEKPGKFAEVFSDTEPEDEEESDDDEEDFSEGINAFVTAVAHRRDTRWHHQGALQPKHIGIENRIVGCITFKKTYMSKPGEKVIHLTLLAVRERFRKLGIGRYLLSQVKDPSIVGQFDAVVVHADNSAVEFFERYGFSDDVVLNSRWKELAEMFTNCTLMSYIPPFTGQTMLSATMPELDIIAMEKELTKWHLRSLDAYQSQVSCIQRMKAEIIHLRALVSTQEEVISSLSTDNETLSQEKFLLEKKFLEYRLSTARTMLNSTGEDEELIDSATLLKELQEEEEARKMAALVRTRVEMEEGESKYLVSQGNGREEEPYDHGKDMEEFYLVTTDFKEGMSWDKSVVANHEVKMITKAMLPGVTEGSYKTRLKQLKDPNMIIRMYFCGTLASGNRAADIIRKGFSEEDFSHGEFGRGLYFSKYPSKAAQFSALGKLILADVGLGHTQTVVKQDRTRTRPDEGYDSVITPGRLANDGGDGDKMMCQEYIVFDVHQAKPLYLVDYAPV